MDNTTGINGTSTTAASSLGLPISTEFKIGLTIAYAVIFFVAFLGNSMGLFVVLKKSSSSSIANLFIANMTVADLLLTITVMPYSVAYLYRSSIWLSGTLGTITCKALYYFMPIAIAASVFTMLFISFDRFYAIFFPLKEKVFRNPKILSTVIWSLSVVLMLPYAIMARVEYETEVNDYVCLQDWPWAKTRQDLVRVMTIFHVVVFIVVYALPLSITIFMYSLICRKLWLRKIPGNATDRNRAAAEKSKRKVVRLLVIICAVFAVCWFPVYVNHYFWFVRPDQIELLPIEVQFYFAWLAHANSAINPCLYILLNAKFRKELLTRLACCPCLEKVKSNFSRSSTKSDSNHNNTAVWRFVSMGRSSAYTLPRSPTEQERRRTNLSLSLVSLKEDRPPTNSPPTKVIRADSNMAFVPDESQDVAMWNERCSQERSFCKWFVRSGN